MSDPSAILAAVVGTIDGDATILALMPDADGAYLNLAPNEITKAVIVSLVIHQDTYAMQSTAYETTLVKILGVERTQSTEGVNALAARIHTLFQDQALTITGYRHRCTRRMEHLAFVEPDEDDPEAHWQHAGGIYEIWAVPNPS